MRAAIAFVLVAAGGLVEAQVQWTQETVRFSPGFSIEAVGVSRPWTGLYQSPPQDLTAWAQCYGGSWTMKGWDPYVVWYSATAALGCGLEASAYVIPNINLPPPFPWTVNTNWDILLLANSYCYKFWELHHADPAANPHQKTAVSARWQYSTSIGKAPSPMTTFSQNTKAFADGTTVADVTHYQPMFSPMDGVYYCNSYAMPPRPYCNVLAVSQVSADYTVKLVKNTPPLIPGVGDTYQVCFWLNLVTPDGTVTSEWKLVTKYTVLLSGTKTWDSDRLADNHIYYYCSAYNTTRGTDANICTDEFLGRPPW
jgi:hypothetical protein